MFFEQIGSSVQHFDIKHIENLIFEKHLHSAIEIYIVLEGKTTVTIENDTPITVNAGECVIFLPNIAHSYYSTGDNGLLISFNKSFAEDFYFAYKTSNTAFSISALAIEYATKLLDEYNNEKNYYRIRGYLYLILGDISTRIISSNNTRISLNFRETILDYLQKNFANDASAESVANYLGYNYSHFSTKFNQEFSCNFTTMLTSFRLDAVTTKIRETDDTMLSIALSSGFGSLRTFNREFKKKNQITPTAYRKANSIK